MHISLTNSKFLDSTPSHDLLWKPASPPLPHPLHHFSRAPCFCSPQHSVLCDMLYVTSLCAYYVPLIRTKISQNQEYRLFCSPECLKQVSAAIINIWWMSEYTILKNVISVCTKPEGRIGYTMDRKQVLQKSVWDDPIFLKTWNMYIYI